MRIAVKGLDGRKKLKLYIRPATTEQGMIYLNCPTYSLVTPQQAKDFADALVDLAEELERRD